MVPLNIRLVTLQHPLTLQMATKLAAIEAATLTLLELISRARQLRQGSFGQACRARRLHQSLLLSVFRISLLFFNTLPVNKVSNRPFQATATSLLKLMNSAEKNKDKKKKDQSPEDAVKGDVAATSDAALKKKPGTSSKEHGGAKGLEPTRYGDWEHGGRCTDF